MFPDWACIFLSGFQNQHFDVSGVPGHIYNLIADDGLVVNSRFDTAYTTGLYINPDTQAVQKFRPRGTWMTALGLVVGTGESQFSLVVSTETSSFADLCALKPKV